MCKKLVLIIFVAIVLTSCSSIGMDSTIINVTPSATISTTNTVMPTLPSSTPAVIDSAPNLEFKESNGRVTITETKCGFSMVIPSEFKQIMSSTGEGGEVKFSLHFDFTKAPYNGECTEDCSSFISVLFQKDEFKYNPQNDKRPFDIIKNPNGHNLLIFEKNQTDKAMEFSYMIEGLPCGGTLSLERKYYDNHESAILDMIKSIAIAGK